MKVLFSILLIFLFIPSLFSQNVFNVDFDARRFSESDSTGRIEIYYTFFHKGMKVNESPIDSFIIGLLSIKISSNTSGVNYVNKKYSFEQNIKDNPLATTGVVKYSLKQGTYIGELKGSDYNNLNSIDSVSFVFTIDGFSPEQFSVSDIQFASSLKKTSTEIQSPFYKNSYEVIPNTSGIYGEFLPVLYFYSELYNLNRGSISDYLLLSYSIFNQYGEIVKTKEKLVSCKNESIVFAEAVNVSKFSSGSYKLEFSLYDSLSGNNAGDSKRFTIINPGITSPPRGEFSANTMTSEFANMENEQLNDVFYISSYLASKKEVQTWNALNSIVDRRSYLFHFWKQRDETSTTAINEFKIVFFNRAEIANKRFETINQKGNKTDRGRIFCLYGEPDEIERYPNEINLNPYEIWNYYRIEGGVIFIFGETFSFIDMNLIHSTMRGELYDPNWKIQIVR